MDKGPRTTRYPVRLSLNISAATAALLDRWEFRTGRRRGELAREALERGVELLVQRYRKQGARRRAERKDGDGGRGMA